MVTTEDKEVKFDPTSMDQAVETARTELLTMDQEAVKLLASWWEGNYRIAGHKRLARVLLGYAPREK